MDLSQLTLDQSKREFMAWVLYYTKYYWNKKQIKNKL